MKTLPVPRRLIFLLWKTLPLFWECWVNRRCIAWIDQSIHFQIYSDTEGNKPHQSSSHYSGQRGLITAHGKNLIRCKNESCRLGFPPFLHYHCNPTLHHFTPPMTNNLHAALFGHWAHQLGRLPWPRRFIQGVFQPPARASASSSSSWLDINDLNEPCSLYKHLAAEKSSSIFHGGDQIEFQMRLHLPWNFFSF